MPELPEVEVVRRGLEPHVLGRRIVQIDVLEPRSLRRQRGGAEHLRAVLLGQRFHALARRGKFLWARLEGADGAETGEALLVHLGMSGQLRVRKPHEAVTAADAASEGPASDPLRHCRLSLHLDDGTRVDFVDQRIFGGLWTSDLAPTSDGHLAGLGSPDHLLPVDLAGIARDVLDPAVDLPAVARRIRERRSAVKTLLLSQDVISGIGNIYADEALWAARTRYDTPGEALSQRRAHQILTEAAAVMRRALAVGGTSFDALYVNVDGRSGYFARSLNAYGKDGEPCSRCGKLMRRTVHQGRSSHFCPRCQRRRPAASHTSR